jgi:hypothetical protein
MIKCFIIINNHGAPRRAQLEAGRGCALLQNPPPHAQAVPMHAHPVRRPTPRAGKPRLTKFYEQLVRHSLPLGAAHGTAVYECVR